MTESELALIKEIRQVVKILGAIPLAEEIDHVFGNKAKSDTTTAYIYKSAIEMTNG